MKNPWLYILRVILMCFMILPSTLLAEDGIHILYDSETDNPDLKTGWGFSALVEKGSLRILVDTGWEVDKLEHNMEKMGLSPDEITHVVISHWHPDHYSGLLDLLDKNKSIKVYLPSDHTMNDIVDFDINTVSGQLKINENVYILGTDPRKNGYGIKDELTLVVLTAEGPTLISGCFHSSWPTLIKKVTEISDKKPYLMVGGGRFIDKSEPELNELAASIQKLGLKNVGLSHCAAGPLPEKIFEKYFPKHTLKARLGKSISLP